MLGRFLYAMLQLPHRQSDWLGSHAFELVSSCETAEYIHVSTLFGSILLMRMFSGLRSLWMTRWLCRKRIPWSAERRVRTTLASLEDHNTPHRRGREGEVHLINNDTLPPNLNSLCSQ